MKRLTTEDFINKSISVHGYRYIYRFVDYKGNRIKVCILCRQHGIFWQSPKSHINGHGCPKCAGVKRYTTKQFITMAIKVHGFTYDYSLSVYINTDTKLKIICRKHGVFLQTPHDHLFGAGCPDCGILSRTKSNLRSVNGMPLYDHYSKMINWCEETRRNPEDKRILQVRCKKCNKWFIPSPQEVRGRSKIINKGYKGESNFYCSEECKHTCSIYNKVLYPEGYAPRSADRPYQKEWADTVKQKAGYKCEICGSTANLVAHHIEPVKTHPHLQADIDNGVCLCGNCHNKHGHSGGCGQGVLAKLICK